MKAGPIVLGFLAALLLVSAAPASAAAPVEVVVVLHDLPGDDCHVVKRSGGSVVDVNAGSVSRALSETITHHVAVLWGQLKQVYESGFVDTATGTVSAVTRRDGKLVVLGAWHLEIEQLHGKAIVAATEAGGAEVPEPARCT